MKNRKTNISFACLNMNLQKLKTMKTNFLIALLLSITALLIVNPVKSQEPDSRKKMYHEEVDDPYLPNQWNNQKTSPAYQNVAISCL